MSGEPKGVYDEITAAAGDRNIWMVGGGDLAAQLAEAGLLDELMVSIAPVTLGAGRPLFPRRYPSSSPSSPRTAPSPVRGTPS